MPYIKEDTRGGMSIELSCLIDAVHKYPQSERDGILNYLISSLVADSIHCGDEPWKYKDIARAVAVFECAKLEFYRRIAGPKEDVAIAENGDIPAYERHDHNRQAV